MNSSQIESGLCCIRWLMVAGICAVGGVAQGAVVSWDGGAGDGLWTNAVNWSGNVLPGAGDTIDITNAVTVNALGLASSGNLPSGATVNISGGATLTMSSGAIRLNGSTLNVASNGALAGAFWDLNNGTINFEAGASVNINDWENKGYNAFRFTLGATGFAKLNATTFRIGAGWTITNAAYTVDLANYVGGTNTVVLVDYANNAAGVTAAGFLTATVNVLNAAGIYTNAHLAFDQTTSDIVLDFSAPVPSPPPTTITTPGLSIRFDSAGFPISVTNAAGLELLNGQLSDGFYLLETNNVKRRFDQIADLGGGAYRFAISGSPEQFAAQFGGTNDYLTVRFTSMTNFALAGERLFFGLTTLNSGLQALALDHMVDVANTRSYVKLERLSLWEKTSTNGMGGFALYQYINPTQEDEALLDLWTKEGLPHPKVAGIWDRAAAQVWLTNWIKAAYDVSYLNIVPNTLAEHYTYLPYAAKMDARAIYMWNLIWRGEYWLLYRQNDEINPSMYPNGLAELQAFRNALSTNDYSLMLHYLCGNIGEADPEFTATTVSSNLQSWGTVTLTAAINTTANTMIVQPAAGVKLPIISTSSRPTVGPPVIPSFFDFKTFRIGSEWLSASSVTDLGNGTWQLSGVTRGQWNTTKQSYSAGTSLRGYLRPYNQDFVPDPNSPLLTTIAARWAALNNILGTTRAEFDGFENHIATGTWGSEKFATRVYENLDHPTVANTSGGAPPDAWLEYRFNRVKDALGGSFQTRQHASLFLGDASRITPGIEELENEMNKFFNVNNRGFSLGSYDVKGVAISTLTNYGLTDKLLMLLKNWKHASLPMSATQRAAMDTFRPYLGARVALNGNHEWATALWRLDGAWLRKWHALGTDSYTHEWHFGQEHGTITPRFYLKNGDTQTLEVPTNLNSGAQQTRIIGRVLPRFITNSAGNINLMSYVGASSITIKGTNTTASDVWNDTILTKYSISPSRDLRTNRGLGLWVTGDDSGGTLVIRLRRGSGQARDYVVPIHFTGRRWIEIPTGEQGWRVKNWGWAIATGRTMDYQYIDSISIGFGHIPANQTCSVLVEGITALAETAEALVNPTITLAGESVSITGTIATENHFILDPNGTFTVYDQLWNVVFTQQLSSGLLPANLTSFRMQSASSSNIWLEVGVQASNETIASPAYTSRGTQKSWLDDYDLVAAGDYEAADLLDSDFDGLLNWQEYRAGTNPTNAASRLVINRISPAGAGKYAVAWQSVTGKTYHLLSTPSLVSPAWVTNIANVVGIAPETVSTGTVATATGFIKVQLAQ